MSTYGTMQDRIADEIARTDLTTQIQKAIQSAIRHYERQRFYFNETIGTFSLSSSQEWYTTTDYADMANLLEIDSVRLTVNSTYYTLIARDFAYLDLVSSSNASFGDPTDYAYYRQQMRLYPVPNQGRTVTISHIKRFETLSTSTDTNAWMTDAEELIRARAKADLYGNVIMEEGRMAICKAMEADALKALREETTRRLSTGKIRPSGF